MAYEAFLRGWYKALQDKENWSKLETKDRVLLFKRLVKEEIFNLPEKPSLWQRFKYFIFGNKFKR